jgi:hypothetical protein
MMFGGGGASLDSIEFNDPALSASAAGMQTGRNIPIFSSYGQFSFYILTFEKKRFGTPAHQRFRKTDKPM